MKNKNEFDIQSLFNHSNLVVCSGKNIYWRPVLHVDAAQLIDRLVDYCMNCFALFLCKQLHFRVTTRGQRHPSLGRLLSTESSRSIYESVFLRFRRSYIAQYDLIHLRIRMIVKGILY